MMHKSHPFPDFKLPVTRDLPQIKQAIEEMYKKTKPFESHPDPAMRQTYKEFTQNALLLANPVKQTAGQYDPEPQKVEKVIAEACEPLKGLVRTATHLNQRNERFIRPEQLDDLVKTALDSFYISESVARPFLEDELKRENIKVAKEKVAKQLPNPIQNPVVTPGDGFIKIQWQLPKDRCDKVVVVRGDSEYPKSPQGGGEVSGSEYIDQTVTPGHPYFYSLYSSYGGEAPASPVHVSGVAFCELRDFRAEFRNHKVLLSWTPPAEYKEVIIFRSENPISRVSVTQGVLSPPAGATPVCQKKGNHHEDDRLIAGKTYYYLAVLAFDGGVFSQGVPTSVSVPVPPPPAKNASAKWTDNGVRLTWDLPAHITLSGVLVKRSDSKAPLHSQEGETVYEGPPKTSHIDNDATPGKINYYAIFTKIHQDVSPIPESTSVFALGQISQFNALPGDGKVEFSVTPPKNSKGVLIVRKTGGYPSSPSDGQTVPASGKSAIDHQVQNGTKYFYALYPIFTTPSGAEAYGAAVYHTVTPMGLPKPVTNLSAEGKGAQAIIKWQLPTSRDGMNSVHIIKHHNPLHLEKEKVLKATEVQGLGDVLYKGLSDNCNDASPEKGRWNHYSAFVISGETAIYSGTVSLFLVEDIADTKAHRDGSRIHLTWHWPGGCEKVKVLRSSGGYATDGSEQHCHVTIVPKALYDNNGGYFDQFESQLGTLYYTVLACFTHDSTAVVATGNTPGARVKVSARPKAKLTFSLKTRWGIIKGSLKKRVYLRWSLNEPISTFSGIRVVKKPLAMPEHKDDGITVGAWQGDSKLAVPPRSVDIEDTAPSFGTPTYYFLFLEDDSDSELIEVERPQWDKLCVS